MIESKIKGKYVPFSQWNVAFEYFLKCSSVFVLNLRQQSGPTLQYFTFHMLKFICISCRESCIFHGFHPTKPILHNYFHTNWTVEFWMWICLIVMCVSLKWIFFSCESCNMRCKPDKSQIKMGFFFIKHS